MGTEIGLGFKFYKSFVSALLLHAAVLGGLYFSVIHTPAQVKERMINVSFAAAPEAEYFESSSTPQILPQILPTIPQEISSAHTIASSNPATPAEVSTKGKKAPLTYLERLQASVQAASHIPQAAIKNNASGSAILRLSFTRKGSILNYSLVQGSGNSLIDTAALATGRKLLHGRFPPAPKSFDSGQQVLTYDFPVSFNSQESL